MDKNETSGSDTFDLDKLNTLIEMMEKHGLTEVHLRKGNEQWRLRRGPQEVMSMVPGSYAPQMAPPQPSASAVSPHASVAPAPVAADAGGIQIKSPTVGTFYSARSPGDPPFVKVGDSVSASTIVCLIEAMKVFNEIPAEISGVVSKILVKNGDSVDFGQPLFELK